MATETVNEIPKVLVVDDEPIMRHMLELVLTTEGWLVELAQSGEEALELCREQQFDLVVLDHWMPGMTGLGVARRLVAQGFTTPIAIFSACLDPALKVAGEAVDLLVIDKLNWKELVRFCRFVDEARLGVREYDIDFVVSRAS